MTGFFTCVKGISGSGKSTRILQLFRFFKNEKHFSFEDVLYDYKKVGVLIKEINVIYLGKFYTTEGIERLQGFDAVTGIFGTSENASNFIKELLKSHNVIIEGSGITQTFRNRPQFIWEYLGANKIYLQYYNYLNNNLEEYKERIIYRSGKLPDKMTMWTKNKSFINDYNNSCQEKENILKTIQMDIDLINDNFDKDLNDFGIKYLNKINMQDMIDEYIKYCAENDYTKINNFNHIQSQRRKLF